MKKLMLIMLLFVSTFSFGQKPESLLHSSTSYVDDFANMFTPEQSHELDGMIRAFKDTTQISIVTVKSLNGLEPYEYATRLGNSWGVGSKSDNGLLILICPSEHKFFAATGRGIQAYLTDMGAGGLYRDYAKDKYKQGDYFGGTRDVLAKYIEKLSPSAKEIHDTQQSVISTKSDNSGILNNLLLILGTIVFIGVMVFSIRRGNNKRLTQHNQLIKVKNKYLTIIKEMESLEQNLINDNYFPESKKILAEIEILKHIKISNPETASSSQFERFINNYGILIGNNSKTIELFNKKKSILDQGNLVYTKYNNPLWRQTFNESITRLTASLQNMLLTRGNDYTEDIKQMNVYITSILDMLSNLKELLDMKDINNIPGILDKISSSNSELAEINNKLVRIVSNDAIITDKARHAKPEIENELKRLSSYIGKEGVSKKSNEITKQNCDKIQNRLHEFDDADLDKAYTLYTLLHEQLGTCKYAMDENNYYETEQARIKKEKQRVARKKSEEEEENKRRRRSNTSAYYGSSSYGSSSSSSDSGFSSSSGSSSDSGSTDSSFGGGSFDGGGGGGDW